MDSRSPLPHTEADAIWTARLQNAVRELREAEAQLANARAELDAVIAAAHDDGLSIAYIARETGLDRKSVYAALKRAGGD